MEIKWQSELVKEYIFDRLKIKNIEDIASYTNDQLSQLKKFITDSMRELQPQIKKKMNGDNVELNNEKLDKLNDELEKLRDELNIKISKSNEINSLDYKNLLTQPGILPFGDYSQPGESLFEKIQREIRRMFLPRNVKPEVSNKIHQLFKENIATDSLDDFILPIKKIQDILNTLSKKDQLIIIKTIYDPLYKTGATLISQIIPILSYPILRGMEITLKFKPLLIALGVVASIVFGPIIAILSPIIARILLMTSLKEFIIHATTSSDSLRIVDYVKIFGFGLTIIPALTAGLYSYLKKNKNVNLCERFKPHGLINKINKLKMKSILKDNYDQFKSNLEALQQKSITLSFSGGEKQYTLLNLFSDEQRGLSFYRDRESYNKNLINSDKKQYNNEDIKGVLSSLLLINSNHAINSIVEIIKEHWIEKNLYLSSSNHFDRQRLLKTHYKDGIIHRSTLKFKSKDNEEIAIPIIITAEQVDKIADDYFETHLIVETEQEISRLTNVIENKKQQMDSLIKELKSVYKTEYATNKINKSVLQQYNQLNSDIAFIAVIEAEIIRLNTFKKERQDIFYDACDHMTFTKEAANNQSNGESSSSSIPKTGWTKKNFSGFNFR